MLRHALVLALLHFTLPLRADWPQLAHDAAHSGTTADQLAPPFSRKWYRLFSDEGIQSGVQPVVADGRLYIATLRGRLHAIDTDTGKDLWVYDGQTGPALHTAAVVGGKVFVALGDTLHAISTQDGTKAWTFKTPLTIWNAPAVHAGVVYFGARDGQLHALDAQTGKPRWSVNLGAPLLNSPAIIARLEHPQVVVAAEDMRVYGLDCGTGELWFRSPKLPGVSFRGYHPVIAPDNSVLVTTTPCAGGDAMQQVLMDMAKEVFGNFASWRIKSEQEKQRLRSENFALMKDPATYERQLAYVRKRLTENPALQTTFIIDCDFGTLRNIPPIVYAESMNGPASPPLVTPDGKVIIKYNALLRSRYEHYSPFLNVGYLDTATGHITPIMDQSRTYGWHDSLLLVHDEQSQLVAAGHTLINTHQDNVNALDLRSLKGDPKPWALNVHEVAPGVAASLYAHVLHDKPLPVGWEWLPRGAVVYGGGSAIDTPVVVSGDSFYFLPTHELSAGVALIAYKMDKTGNTNEKTKPEEILKEKLLSTDTFSKWDWDTLEADRLKGTLAGVPQIPAGTRQNSLTEQARRAVSQVPREQLEALILEPRDSALRTQDFSSPHHILLDRAVNELISRTWRPLLFPAAKAPAEAYRLFTDPSETLYTLALAYPQLRPETQAKVRAHVAALRQPGRPLAGPLGADTYDPTAGDVRSAYDEAPASLLKFGRPLTRPANARLYPFYLWAHVTSDFTPLQHDWPAIRKLIPATPPKDEPDLGNARLSTLIAAARLSRQFDDPAIAQTTLDAAVSALRDRLTYELAHTGGGLITTSGLRSLLGRWHFLTPDLAAVLRPFTRDIHQHLMNTYITHHRPAWHVAWNVELLWRNEAPFSFPDMSADIFAARGLLLQDRATGLASHLDIPWCKADEHYIQKLALLCTAARH